MALYVIRRLAVAGLVSLLAPLFRLVRVGGEEVHLTNMEYKLLAENAGKVLTYKYLLRQVWGSAMESDMASLRVFMVSLRKKIGKGWWQAVFADSCGHRVQADLTYVKTLKEFCKYYFNRILLYYLQLQINYPIITGIYEFTLTMRPKLRYYYSNQKRRRAGSMKLCRCAVACLISGRTSTLTLVS